MFLGCIIVAKWKLFYPSVLGGPVDGVQHLLHQKCTVAGRDDVGFVDYPICASACCTAPMVFDPAVVNPVGWRAVIESCMFDVDGCVMGGADLLTEWTELFELQVPSDVLSDDVGCMTVCAEVGDLMVRGGWPMLGAVLVHSRPRLSDFLWPIPRRRLRAYVADRLAHRAAQAPGHNVQVFNTFVVNVGPHPDACRIHKLWCNGLCGFSC